MADWYLIGSITFIVAQFGFLFGRHLYINYVRPFLCYKLTVFDVDDEFSFIKRKNKAVIVKDRKGYILFNKNNTEGEFYSIPLDEKSEKNISKRDDLGMVTYYYYRNNTQPIKIGNRQLDKLLEENKKKWYEFITDLFTKKSKEEIIREELYLENRPIKITNQEKVSIVNDSSALAKVLKSQIFDSSISLNKQEPFKIDTKLLIILVVIILIVIFKDKIMAFIGV